MPKTPRCPCCGETGYTDPRECSFCEDQGHAHGPLITKTGRVLTESDIQALADEAERGYDIEHLKRREP